MKRTYSDSFYVNEDNTFVKDSFVAACQAIGNSPSIKSIADVGCAAGAFVNYLSNTLKDKDIYGIDILDLSLDKARKDFPHLNFLKGDVNVRDSIKQRFDVITLLGVLDIFDNYDEILSNLFSWLNPHGRLIIHNMVSDYDYDVFVKHKPSSSKMDNADLELGWNIISKKTLELVCEEHGAEITHYADFELSVDIPKTKNTMRTWTEKNIKGGRDIINALHIRQPQKIVVIQT